MVQVAADSCIISMKKEFENEPRKAAIVVDDDVDVYNEREVQWAVVTRTYWDKDIEVIRKVQRFRKWLGDAVMIIDATRPGDVNFPEKNEIPCEAVLRAGKKWDL